MLLLSRRMWETLLSHLLGHQRRENWTFPASLQESCALARQSFPDGQHWRKGPTAYGLPTWLIARSPGVPMCWSWWESDVIFLVNYLLFELCLDLWCARVRAPERRVGCSGSFGFGIGIWLSHCRLSLTFTQHTTIRGNCADSLTHAHQTQLTNSHL